MIVFLFYPEIYPDMSTEDVSFRGPIQNWYDEDYPIFTFLYATVEKKN